MSVFSKVKDFFVRNKNKFILGGVVTIGSLYFLKYAQQRLKQWQEKEALEFLERNRKQNHFESIDRTCNQTILNLSTTLIDVIFKKVNTDDVVEALKSNPENKLELWNTLKVLVFVKLACIIYSLVILVVTLRIQLNIVGGYLYREPNSITTEIQEKYLSLCQTFLNNTINTLVDLVEKEVSKILKTFELNKQLKLSDLEGIFWTIQTSIAAHEQNPIDKLLEYIIPGEIPRASDLYSNLISDTADLLDSDEVKSISTHCLNRGFVLLGDQMSEFYLGNDPKIKDVTNIDPNTQFQNPFDAKKPLAKLLPILNGLLLKQSFPHNLVQQLLSNEKLKVLGANVYESLL